MNEPAPANDSVSSKEDAAGSAAKIKVGPLQAIKVQNLLSFGPETPSFPLKQLNVLIGPNGAGKSNLLDCIDLLRNSPGDMSTVTRRGGGIDQWVWKGEAAGVPLIQATILDPDGTRLLEHSIAFRAAQFKLSVQEEMIAGPERPPSGASEVFYFLPAVGPAFLGTANGWGREFNREKIDVFASILQQRKDPEAYPEFASLTRFYNHIRMFRDWPFGRNNSFRQAKPTDLRSDRLEEDFSNLGLYLSRYERRPKIKKQIVEMLRDLYEGLVDFDVGVEGGMVQVFFAEGDYTIPATRLSDGSMRYLSLLAILCDPEPPPLVCLEEPELGMHPDLIPKIADLLVAASQRCQLIVTTHSAMLVDALSEQPESVVVCEKVDGATSLRRLDAEELAPWLEKYRLGQLWMRGKLGGTRW